MRSRVHGLVVAVITFIASLSAAHAQTTIPVEGSVVDAERDVPIGGAIVRSVERGNRTFTSASGHFRLPVEAGTRRITISSIGYFDTTFSVTASAGMSRITVRLRPSALALHGVEVTAGLTADQIIQRSIDRKEDNRRAAKTVQGLLYSKFAVDIEGDAFGKLPDEDRHSIIETFSRAYYSDRGPRLVVIQRRQTANIPAASNLLVLGNFVSFYDDEIPVLNTHIPSPLNRSTLSRYSFTLRERASFNGETVYVIDVKAATRLLPAFEGTLKIVASNYNLIEVDLHPSASTAIAFVHDLRFHQRFERFANDIWQPTLLEINGGAKVELLKGFAVVDASLSATSIFTELVVNDSIPDSIYADERIVAAAPSADSSQAEFWEGNTLSELSDAEKETYRHVDSLVAAADTTSDRGGLQLGLSPVIEFNRVGSLSIGAGITPRLGRVGLDARATYSIGLRRFFGSADINVNLVTGGEDWPSLGLTAGVFWALRPSSVDHPYPTIVNTAVAALFHRDYDDYHLAEGWRAGLASNWGDVELRLGFEESRQQAERITTSRSIFVHEPFRDNPPITDGDFTTATATLRWGRPEGAIVISSATGIEAGATLTFLKGYQAGGADFNSSRIAAHVGLPTISTGYSPMRLTINAVAGGGSATLPPQYQFRVPTSTAIVAAPTALLSAPVGVYGGTCYATLVGEHNFSDILWRAVGLPTYEGRGIEFLLSAAAAYSETTAPTGYASTRHQWYTELGFGLARIPTFVSNVFYLGLDARWGVGPLGAGRFGAAVTLTSPF